MELYCSVVSEATVVKLVKIVSHVVVNGLVVVCLASKTSERETNYIYTSIITIEFKDFKPGLCWPTFLTLKC